MGSPLYILLVKFKSPFDLEAAKLVIDSRLP
jgi:hypothetical protein